MLYSESNLLTNPRFGGVIHTGGIIQVIRPIALTASNLLNTNAVNTYTDWSAGTTYNTGQRVTYGNYYWESLIDGNVGQNPESTTLKWVQVSSSNKWAMFDTRIASETSFAGNLTVSIQPNQRFTSLSLFNVTAIAVQVEILDKPLAEGGVVIYSQTRSLSNSLVSNWYTYFFEEFDLGSEVFFHNVPPFKRAVINITLIKAESDTYTKIGAFIAGQLFDTGLTRYGASYGIRDYSIKDTDEFGVTTFVERNFSKRMNATVFVENGQLNFLNKLFIQLRAQPTAWVASTDNRFQGTTIFGYLKDWNVEIEYPNHSLISIEIEGLT